MKNKVLQLFVAAVLLSILTVFAPAQNKVVPIFFLSHIDEKFGDREGANFGEMLGGVDERGEWLDMKTTFGKLTDDEKISLFNLDAGKEAEIPLGKIDSKSAICDGNYFVRPKTKIAAKLAVGTTADWNAMPRLPKPVGKNDASYTKTVADVLKSRWVSESPARIKQAYRIDLEGDGIDEIVLVANLHKLDKNRHPKLGSYSFVVIRKLTEGKARTIFLTGNYEKGERNGGVQEIAAIADLNGDGVLEIVVEVSGYGGDERWINTFEMKNGEPTEVKALYSYCGF